MRIYELNIAHNFDQTFYFVVNVVFTKLLILDTVGIIIRARHDAESTASLVAAINRLEMSNGSCQVFSDKNNYNIFEIKEKSLPHTYINKSLLKSIA